jgi:hypothetical protein
MDNLQVLNENDQLAKVADDSQIKEFRIKVQNFTKLLNSKPQSEKIQKHQGYDYLPISHIEKELDKIYFGLVQYEVISYQQIFNEISCHARIKVFHPVINQWMQYDGLGSAVIQQDKDTSVADFHLYKKGNALQLSLPKSYAEAIKNASKKIGKRFGADLNRKFEDEYVPMLKEEKIKVDLPTIQEGTPQWQMLVRDLINGISIEKIEEKVKLTEEQRIKLMEEAL